ncbi:MAG: efflux RND transporter periplasmic adaptor subunit [Pseudomonadota bacterium]|nr:efflux RND transporter periplasmic adaptor subunit [Pseudomonadota bacterium]
MQTGKPDRIILRWRGNQGKAADAGRGRRGDSPPGSWGRSGFGSGCFVFSLLLVLSPCALAKPVTAVVASETYAPEVKAYAEVEPVGELSMRVHADGVISHLKVLPGDEVKKGEVLARLSGPQIHALRIQALAQVDEARSSLRLALHQLRIQAALYGEQVATVLDIHQAKAQVRLARARLSEVLAHYAEVRAATLVRAPVNATVETVGVTNGSPVVSGETLLKLQPADRLWLVATVYGPTVHVIRSGVSAIFHSADTGRLVPVTVRGMFPRERADGGVRVGLLPGTSPGWVDGEKGVVRFFLAPKTWPAVPTQALVLDRGHWWVLVLGKKGMHPVMIKPGPAVNNLTLVRKGLKIGDKVVVQGAYLYFHKALRSAYQPPD